MIDTLGSDALGLVANGLHVQYPITFNMDKCLVMAETFSDSAVMDLDLEKLDMDLTDSTIEDSPYFSAIPTHIRVGVACHLSSVPKKCPDKQSDETSDNCQTSNKVKTKKSRSWLPKKLYRDFEERREHEPHLLFYDEARAREGYVYYEKLITKKR
jgi:hypothetical protein